MAFRNLRSGRLSPQADEWRRFTGKVEDAFCHHFRRQHAVPQGTFGFHLTHAARSYEGPYPHGQDPLPPTVQIQPKTARTPSWGSQCEEVLRCPRDRFASAGGRAKREVGRLDSAGGAKGAGAAGG